MKVIYKHYGLNYFGPGYWRGIVTHSQLFEGFKRESKQKTTEEQGVGACSLARSTLDG